MEGEHLLIRKLDRFIRKYYTNRIIRGSLLAVGVLAGSYLLFVILENIFSFDSIVRTVLFFLFLGIAFVTIALWIFQPIFNYFHLGKRISYENAAVIIGQHFSEIQDKLLNTLQLIRQRKHQEKEIDLLIASIDQKINNMKVFQFNLVITYKRNLRYLKVTIPPVAIIILALLIAPAFISEPTLRIVDYTTNYLEPSFFEVHLLNEELSAFQQEDFELHVSVKGEEIPSDLYIETEGYKYRMKRNSPTRFSFLFKSLQKETTFRISANKFRSDDYLIRVFPRPTILSFNVILTFPNYTGKDSEELENTGDLVVPKGTKVEWRWITEDVETLHLRMLDREIKLTKKGSNLFFYNHLCISSGSYSIRPENEYSCSTDSLFYRIICQEDSYPSILTEVHKDSVMPTGLFFNGSVKDDYGFSRLEFHYQITSGNDTIVNEQGVVELPVSKDVREEFFYYSIDVDQYIKRNGDRMNYYFEVWDNDGINGPKSVKSEIREIKALTINEIKAYAEESEEKIKENIRNSLKEAKDVEKAIDQLNRKLIEKQQLDWQEKREIKELINKNEEMLNMIKSVKEENLRNIQLEEKFLQTSQAIFEKQKRLNELMEELMTEEMKKTLQELRELMDQVDKEKLKNLIEEMKMTAKELEQQLDRNLELFKQIEFERKLEENISELRRAAEKQEKLAEQVEQKKSISESIQEEQEKLNTHYDSIQKELEKLQKMDEELEQPVGIEKTKPQQDSINSTLNDAVEKMEEKDEKGALKSQKSAGKQMKNLANMLELMQSESEVDQYAEDAQQIRQILENLLTISFDQEELINRTRSINRNDPGFQNIIAEQKQLNENLEPVKDSLTAIGKRQFLIQPVITRELNSINRNIEETVKSLTERNMAMALSKQQFSMTSLNNLAVLLDEAMEQMNQNLNMSMQGSRSKMCQNPTMGKGKKSIKNIRQLQQKMSEQMERIRKGLREQQDNKGQKGKAGEQGLNEQIARLAAEQEAIREELKRYEQQLKEQGIMDQGNIQNAIKEMEQNERDLINKQVTRESLLRQQKILTRLLESEKAEQIREQQEKRESDEAKNQKYSNPEQKLEYNKYSVGGSDILRYQILPVKHFYRNKTTRYLIQIHK
ncbi:MAG: hypothetical protein ISS17_03090 [Bacteroidales bacterium]|nr:hypothetical protein [Bacteroidales bacterium]